MVGYEMIRKGIRRRFMRDQNGSVATVFAFSFIPALLAVGVGVDFAHAVAETLPRSPVSRPFARAKRSSRRKHSSAR